MHIPAAFVSISPRKKLLVASDGENKRRHSFILLLTKTWRMGTRYICRRDEGLDDSDASMTMYETGVDAGVSKDVDPYAGVGRKTCFCMYEIATSADIDAHVNKDKDVAVHSGVDGYIESWISMSMALYQYMVIHVCI